MKRFKSNKRLVAILVAAAVLITGAAALLSGTLAQKTYTQIDFPSPYTSPVGTQLDVAGVMYPTSAPATAAGSTLWSTSDDGVATVVRYPTADSTTITAAGVGVAGIFAATDDGYLTRATMCQVVNSNLAKSYGLHRQ